MKKEIPTEVTDLLTKAAQTYAESPATTGAGRVLRFLARFVTVETVIKILTHKIRK